MFPENITRAEKNKIVAIFENTPQICKTQCHWSSWMEWQGINQSASQHVRHMEYVQSICLLVQDNSLWE